MTRSSVLLILGGLSKAEALRAAQRDMIASGQFSNPYYWAAFEVVGDAGPVEGTPSVVVEPASEMVGDAGPVEKISPSTTITAIGFVEIAIGGAEALLALVGVAIWVQRTRSASK